MNTEAQGRYIPNPGLDGRKEKDGFVCSSTTRKGIIRTNCVAVKIDTSGVQIRDTKDIRDTTLNFTRDEWDAFVQGVKKGEFDPT